MYRSKKIDDHGQGIYLYIFTSLILSLILTLGFQFFFSPPNIRFSWYLVPTVINERNMDYPRRHIFQFPTFDHRDIRSTFRYIFYKY